MIALVDYGLCNLDSIARALARCGAEPCVTRDPAVVSNATRIILPGVGSYAAAMDRLTSNGLAAAIRSAVVERNVPFLGICLGMQLMAESGTEGGECVGLRLLSGRVERLPVVAGERAVHIGWNEVRQQRDHKLLAGIPTGSDFYFVHSYHFAGKESYVVATTPFAGGFASVIALERVFGVQFHPEKSQRVGLQLLRNFLAISA